MRPLKLVDGTVRYHQDYIQQTLDNSHTKAEFLEVAKQVLEHMNFEFYDIIGLILKHIGFENARVSRGGDTNNRIDAIIIDNENSIPIEIKSPGESKEINIKSIRQACENKVIILSRKFYKTTNDTTSLAIAFRYPPERSDVYELIEDIKKAYQFNIGIIDIDDLLSLVWDLSEGIGELDFNYFNTFSGKFNYDKALI